jgi:transposase
LRFGFSKIGNRLVFRHSPARARGEEAHMRKNLPGYRARRWVVERTHSWMNRFRRLLIRWEKKLANFLAMIHIACAYICMRQIRLFG